MARPSIRLSPKLGITGELHVLREMWPMLPVEARADIVTLGAMRLAALPRPPKRLLKQISLVVPA